MSTVREKKYITSSCCARYTIITYETGIDTFLEKMVNHRLQTSIVQSSPPDLSSSPVTTDEETGEPRDTERGVFYQRWRFRPARSYTFGQGARAGHDGRRRPCRRL